MDERAYFVGTKACFGVELRVRFLVPGVFADVFLWIGGESLGRENDAVAIYALMGALDGLLVPSSEIQAKNGAANFRASSIWESFEEVGYKYSVESSEFFDRYEMCCVSDDDVARFFWKERCLEPLCCMM